MQNLEIYDQEKNLEKTWAAELEILDSIDKFCRKEELKYSLAFGTLLGAVRHGGFIPWDDDVDILMPRKDYEYFVTHWTVPGFILQNKRTNNDYTQCFTKIRKDHTTFLQYEFEKNVSYHTGIFVDIFPGDRVAPTQLTRKIQFILFAINLLYSREYTSGSESSKLESILLKVPRSIRLKIRSWAEKRMQRWDYTGGKIVNASTIDNARLYFQSNLFDRMTEIEFCGKKYMCTAEYESFLLTCYGDYMKLPPEDERRIKHHPLIVDFERNFGES
ncbi:MAG: LicD family protein [Thermoguttaceae bacterium]|nr:LicD family protein [Thermoguttaceae bacterium]